MREGTDGGDYAGGNRGVSARGTDAAALDAVLERLSGSAFRRRFRLRDDDLDFVRRRGLETVRAHAAAFVAERLAPAAPPNDGRQTPWRGHPVFPAQHATATCCRRCLQKWHHLPRGRKLTEEDAAYVVALLLRWIERQADAAPPPPQLALGLD